MSTATPTPADWQAAQPWIDAFTAGEIDRRAYWHNVQRLIRNAHPEFSGHDATRVARIMAPFPLKDGPLAPR